MDVTERYMLKPMLGFDFESILQDAFRERGQRTNYDQAVALNYGKASLDRVMWRLGVSADYKFDRLEMNGRFLYGLKIAGDNSVQSQHWFMPPASVPFTVNSVDIGNYAFDLGFGGSWNLDRRRSAKLFMDYNANITKNSGIHTTSIGFLWKR